MAACLMLPSSARVCHTLHLPSEPQHHTRIKPVGHSEGVASGWHHLESWTLGPHEFRG